MKTPKRIRGDWGEAQALAFLESNGYAIAARNYRIRTGELDIIAWHAKPRFGQTLCFIEVKTRAANDGSAERATEEGDKLNRIKSAAIHYCLNNGVDMNATPIQFEQVSIYNDDTLSDPIVRHFVIPVD